MATALQMLIQKRNTEKDNGQDYRTYGIELEVLKVVEHGMERENDAERKADLICQLGLLAILHLKHFIEFHCKPPGL